MNRKPQGLYRVGRSFAESVLCMGADTARDEARRIGEGFSCWRYDARGRHWHLVADRSSPGRASFSTGYGGTVEEPLEATILRIGGEVLA